MNYTLNQMEYPIYCEEGNLIMQCTPEPIQINKFIQVQAKKNIQYFKILFAEIYYTINIK